MRRKAALTALLLFPALAACGGDTDETATSPTGSPTPSPSPTVVEGVLAAYTPGATAITYDPSLAPAGGRVKAELTPSGGGLGVKLTVSGLKPNHTYGTHVHVKPCGAQATDAGGHLQHTPDPKASASPPSVDPSFANPTNEVWLDLTTDASGAGTSTATAQWRFTDAPRAIVLHAEKTKTAPGEAGTAGARVACLTLPPGDGASPTPTGTSPGATPTGSAPAGTPAPTAS